ncbi:MAG: hypothetical protein K2X29_06930, partial [Candidatus Obscuribacterales bacterium]|nr:hypothetical protein [Candidatus Obscuribacterales bacterium]
NYWALGHVHERKVLSTNPWVCYPGNSQGRSIREPGARGCYIVTVNSPTDVDIKFQETDTVRWFTSEVNISGISNLNELEFAVINRVNELATQAEGRALICRLSLTGRGPIYEQLHRAEQLVQFRDHCRVQLKNTGAFRWIEQLDFDCMPDIDLDEVRARKDLMSFVLNEADQLRAANLKDMLMPIIGPLFQHSQASRFLAIPDDEQLNKLLDEASLLCFDKLENG